MKKEEIIEAKKKDKELNKFVDKVNKEIANIYKKISKIIGAKLEVDSAFYIDNFDRLSESGFVQVCILVNEIEWGENLETLSNIPVGKGEFFSILEEFPAKWLWTDFEEDFKAKIKKAKEIYNKKDKDKKEDLVKSGLSKLTRQEKEALGLA